MSKKNHLSFRNPLLGVENFNYGSRFPGQNEEDEERLPDYRPLSETYRISLNAFKSNAQRRIQERNLLLNVPGNITSIDIEFFGWFDSKGFENYYRQNFGLSPVSYYDFNTRGTFAVVDHA